MLFLIRCLFIFLCHSKRNVHPCIREQAEEIIAIDPMDHSTSVLAALRDSFGIGAASMRSLQVERKTRVDKGRRGYLKYTEIHRQCR